MARRIPRQPVAAALALAAASLIALAAPAVRAAPPATPSEPSAQRSGERAGVEAPPSAAEPVFAVLAHHGFDGEHADTGPDTFRVFEQARGRVTRTAAFRWSGEYSVEIRDVAGDGDFPELQGYFDARATGRLFAHFALLVTDPAEPFNVALAGPGGFGLRPDGLAFWLENRDGVLRHVSDGIPKKLLALVPFTWYQFDLLVDLDRARYQLAVSEEGSDDPVVALADQPTATAQPGSAVDKFSFIGDRGEDVSRVVYYVDDVVIGADTGAAPPPFVAPGRRKLFVELTGDHGALVDGELRCPDGLGAAECAGDVAVLDGDWRTALNEYTRVRASQGETRGLLLKLADAYFLAGDLAHEKALRERIYGTLDPLDGRR
jgi:hypothetical protein